jgi:hypothetical protein
MTLPKKQGERKVGQLLAGSGQRVMVSTSLWITGSVPPLPPIACMAQCMPTAGSRAVAGNDRATWAMLKMPQPIDTRLAPRPAYSSNIEHDDLSSLSVELG